MQSTKKFCNIISQKSNLSVPCAGYLGYNKIWVWCGYVWNKRAVTGSRCGSCLWNWLTDGDKLEQFVVGKRESCVWKGTVSLSWAFGGKVRENCKVRNLETKYKLGLLHEAVKQTVSRFITIWCTQNRRDHRKPFSIQNKFLVPRTFKKPPIIIKELNKQRCSEA